MKNPLQFQLFRPIFAALFILATTHASVLFADYPTVVEGSSVQVNTAAPRSELTVKDKLGKVFFPRLSFDATPLGQTVETLSAMADAQNMPVNIVRLAPGGDDPKVTISLRNISLDRALYYIAQSVNFRVETENDAVVLRPSAAPGEALKTSFFQISRSALVRMAGIEGAKPEANTANKAPTPIPAPTQIEIEKDIRSFLERAGVPFDAVPGATLALGADSLIVTNTPGNLNKVGEILERYRHIQQVEIETRFLEVDQGDLDEFGIQWGLSNTKNIGKNGTGYTMGTTNRTLATSLNGTTTQNDIVITGLDSSVGDKGTLTRSIAAPTIAGGIDTGANSSPVAAVSGVIGAFNVDAVVNALSRKSGSNLMSSPRLTVLSGERAEITVAKEMIYPRSYGDVNSNVSRGSIGASGSAVSITAGTPRDFTKRNVGVEMGVTATVEDNKSISMTLEPCVTEFEGFVEYGGPSVAVSGSTTVTVPSGFYQPVFNVRRIRTEVTVNNGATIIMGGLTRDETITVEDKVPLLGDIPYLGRFFRNEGESTQKKDLLIFVTANIVGADGVPSAKPATTLPEQSGAQPKTKVAAPSANSSNSK
jgi:general secretion pathway protein D